MVLDRLLKGDIRSPNAPCYKRARGHHGVRVVTLYGALCVRTQRKQKLTFWMSYHEPYFITNSYKDPSILCGCFYTVWSHQPA